jgi:hypothetical protein
MRCYVAAVFQTAEVLVCCDGRVGIVLVGACTVDLIGIRDIGPFVVARVRIHMGSGTVPSISVCITKDHGRVRADIGDITLITRVAIGANECTGATGDCPGVVAVLGMLRLGAASASVILRRGAQSAVEHGCTKSNAKGGSW